MSELLAHATYTLSDDDQIALQGADYAFLASPLTDPWNIAIFVSAAVFVGSLIYAANRVQRIRDRIRFFRGRARSYQEFLPLILRLSLGAALIGAGSQHHLLSPAVVTDQPLLAVLQVTLGLLLLAGFALIPVTLGAIVLTVGATVMYPVLFHHLEIIGALIAFLVLGQAKPSLDDLFGMSMYPFAERFKLAAPLLLRLGIGIPFLISAFRITILNPHLFGAYVEQIGATQMLPLSTEMWVLSAALLEIALGVTLLLGFHARIAGLIAFVLINASLYFAGESAYAHMPLLGTLFVLMITGAGMYSVDDRLAKRRQQYQKA